MGEFYAESNLPLDPSWAESAFFRLLENTDLGCVWLAEAQGAPVGYAVLTVRYTMEHAALSGHVDDLYVKPAFRRQGVARALISELSDECEIRSCKSAYVEVGDQNVPAIELYRQFGLDRFRDGRVVLSGVLRRSEMTSGGFKARSRQCEGEESHQLTENILEKVIEHNNWANLQLIRACSALSDDQLDARPQSVEQWSIRVILIHLVESQQGYLSLLTLPPEERDTTSPSFAQLEEAANTSGVGLLTLARAENGWQQGARLQTQDGYFVEPWVVMAQAINHATDHRKQIASILRALGISPPRLDGWAFGEATKALVPMSR